MERAKTFCKPFVNRKIQTRKNIPLLYKVRFTRQTKEIRQNFSFFANKFVSINKIFCRILFNLTNTVNVIDMQQKISEL